jgi:hypothetical protein
VCPERHPRGHLREEISTRKQWEREQLSSLPGLLDELRVKNATMIDDLIIA